MSPTLGLQDGHQPTMENPQLRIVPPHQLAMESVVELAPEGELARKT